MMRPNFSTLICFFEAYLYIRFCTSLGALVAPQYKRESPTRARASAEKVISFPASICVRDLLPRLLHVLEAPHGVLQAVALEDDWRSRRSGRGIHLAFAFES